MKISFLYKIPEPESTTPENTIYNLSIDKTMEYVCSDVKAAREFLKIAAKPLRYKENIIYRREILDDFIRNAGMYYELYDILGKFYDVAQTSEREKKNRYSLRKHNDNAVIFQSIKQMLQMTALSMRDTLALLFDFHEILADKKLESEGFIKLKERIDGIVLSDSYAQLKKMSAYFREITEIESIESSLSLDEDCCISLSRLVSCNSETVSSLNSEKKFSLFNFKKVSRDEKVTSCRLTSISRLLGNEILFEALYEPAKMMGQIISSIYDEFSGIKDELLFYKAGMKFISYMQEKKIPYVFPEMTYESEFESDGLLDTFLTAYFPVASYVTPNDAHIGNGKDGILVFGGNNTGKTVYLRSIGSAQIFAQAGFPITAKSARIGIRSGIFTQFASGEKEFEEGNEAGRFEQEVREIASLVEKSDEHALVLFNETFQTTAYAEGAEGLYHVLRLLSARKTNWVLVSHLSGLTDKFGDNISHLRTSDGYKMLSER